MPYKNKEDRIAHDKKYNEDNQAKIKIKRKIYRQIHSKQLKAQSAIYREDHKLELLNYRETRRQNGLSHKYTVVHNLKIKTEVITHYGNGKCACLKCGYNDIRALSIDHINGDGAEHRKRLNMVRGNHIYQWLRKNNFPTGYQTLCMNCQLIKRIENQECTHNNKGAE